PQGQFDRGPGLPARSRIRIGSGGFARDPEARGTVGPGYGVQGVPGSRAGSDHRAGTRSPSRGPPTAPAPAGQVTGPAYSELHSAGLEQELQGEVPARPG